MPKRRKRHTQRLNHNQKLGLIPGGPVSAQRALRDEIEVETRATSVAGAAMAMGQIVTDPIRKLYQAGALTLGDVHAAQAFQQDHDRNYASCINVLSAIVVDDGRAAAGAAERQFEKVKRSERYHRALDHLNDEQARVAKIMVVEDPFPEDRGIPATFQAMGADLLPSASKQEQISAGKGVLIATVREIARVYGYRNSYRNRIANLRNARKARP